MKTKPKQAPSEPKQTPREENPAVTPASPVESDTPDHNAPRLVCAGCGKIGVSICAKCARTGYRRVIARANPLQERDPELYKRLDEMSRLSLEDNKESWDEFCIEINAGDYYEHLPTLVEIVQEGIWRTDALKPFEWLRAKLAKRGKRSFGTDDYGPAVDAKRRPSWAEFDKRNGALIEFGTQPFAEFEVQDGDGNCLTSEEAVDYQSGQTTQDEDGHTIRVMPADRDSLQSLGRLTLAESYEADRCEELALALKQHRPTFERALADAIANQQGLAERMELDQDEAEVVAVKELLWYVRPRKYLNFLDGADKRRIRNAWDRLDRKMKNPEWVAALKQALREFAGKRRELWNREYWADYYLRTDRENWQKLVPPGAARFNDSDDRDDLPRPKWDSSRGCGIPSEERLRQQTQADKSKGLVFQPSKEPPNLDSYDGSRPVALGWDLTAKQQALYRSSASKPKPRRKTKLYSE